LDRPLTVNPPTGRQISYLSIYNTTQATDQKGKKKLNYFNEAGKVIKVVEEDANGSPNGLYDYVSIRSSGKADASHYRKDSNVTSWIALLANY
jgi:hypothetical protein